MFDIFSPAASDQSIFYLHQIFGNVGTVLPLGTDTASVNPLLGQMFRTFNSVILAIGAFIVVYITVVGVIKTAAEGEVLGKQWSSIWIPLRTVIGIAALIPSSAGYCAVQIVMMWVIVQGVGAADTLWGTALGWIQLNGNPIANMSKKVNTISAGTETTMRQLFQGLVCQESAMAGFSNPNQGATTGGYYCSTAEHSNSTFCQSGNAFNPQSNTYAMGPNGVCGTLTFCNVASTCNATPTDKNPTTKIAMDCASCTGQVAGLGTIVGGMSALAKLLVNADYEYRQFYNNSYNQNTYKTPDWIQSYCSENNISACCVPTNNPNLQSSQTCQGSSGNFPAVNGTSLQDASEKAMSMYWKYVVQPELSQSGFSTPNFVNEATTAYQKSINDELAPLLQQLADNTTLSKTFEQAKNYGWILAGGYYYSVARVTNGAQDALLPTFKVDGNPAGSNNDLSGYRTNYSAANLLVEAAVAQADQDSGTSGVGSGSSSSLPSEMGTISAGIRGVGSDIIKSFMNTVSESDSSKVQDPLVKIQMLGHALMTAVEIIFFIVLIANLILSILGYISVFALGTGAVNPLGPALTTMNMLFIPVLLGFMAIFFTFGGLLAVYTPLIPYVVFTFGAMGWFIATIEAMVAGPLVALGIIMPGHHELLGKGEKALGLLLGIFLRPSLMIFGMIAGMILSAVVLSLINAGFHAVMMSITAAPGIFELIFFMAAYIFMIITAINKSYALIYLIPDRVLTWIGEQASSHGEAEALGEVKRGAEGAGAGGASFAGGARAGGQGFDAGRSEKSNLKKEAQDKKDENQGKAGTVGKVD